MVIKVWNNFTKRVNSTAQPVTAGTDINAYLKEETSIERPSFILQTPVADYTYVQAFGHYYFVDDVVNLDASRCEVICSMDVLATYKADILGYTAFVERAASIYDQFINDPLLSQKQILIRETQNLTDVSSFFTSGAGCFLVECLAKNMGVVLYATNSLDPYKYILDPGVYTSADKQAWIASTISQAFDLDVYIGSVKWFPFTASDLGSTLNPTTEGILPLGPVDIGIAAGFNYDIYKVSQSYMSKQTEIDINLPSTNNFNDFRDCNNQYSQYNLYLPGVGVINLDASVVGYAINSGMKIAAQIYVDLVSGEITYILRFKDANNNLKAIIGRYSGNVSVDVPIGKAVVDTVKSAKMFAQSVTTGATVGGAWGALGGAVVGGVEAIYNHLTPDTSMVGGSGNKTEIFHNTDYIVLGRKQFDAKEYPTAVAGRPLMQNVQLSSLSGYVKCGNASVPVNCHSAERDAINRYLNTGFYIE